MVAAVAVLPMSFPVSASPPLRVGGALSPLADLLPAANLPGIAFLWENMDRLKEEDADRMPIGFEVAFPSLIEIARSMDLDVPYDALALRDIYAKRAFKLKRIPTDVMHEVPTTLLHSPEGMPSLDWKKLLRLQCADGSFLFSPASTAFALMQTRDSKSLSYLKKTTRRFNGGVPNVYPIDLFEGIWAVDRLERLGILDILRKRLNGAWTTYNCTQALEERRHQLGK